MNPAIWVSSAIWSSGSWIFRRASKTGRLPVARLDARVVSVGNLQAGGAGKTPLVAQIVREACDRGLKVCVLTRGYLSEWEIGGGLIEPGSPAADPGLAGDEPALLHWLEPRAWIAVGANRVRQYEMAKEKAGSTFDLVVLDDGFQHWKIHKDVEVLAVTSARMGERLFRDWPSEASRADLVVWTKGSTPPRVGAKARVKVRYRLSAVSEKPVWIVCGVGDPVSVVEAAKSSGFDVRREIALGDHAEFSRADIERWLGEAGAAGCSVAITGKDWVKWQALGVRSSDVLVLEPTLEFESGRDDWERVLWG